MTHTRKERNELEKGVNDTAFESTKPGIARSRHRTEMNDALIL
jgi:hypothetical protein